MGREKFWLVLGIGTPAYRHPTAKSAQLEAERLAMLHRGEPFTVLEAIATARKMDIAWEKLESKHGAEDIPF